MSVVVDDLSAAVSFFSELGLEAEGDEPAAIEGSWVDRVAGIDGVRVEVVMMRTPDGHGRLELTKFSAPAAISAGSTAPNALGLRSIMFAVDDIDDAVTRMRAHGAELVGDVAQYENIYRLCYLRGPAGVIVALAEELG